MVINGLYSKINRILDNYSQSRIESFRMKWGSPLYASKELSEVYPRGLQKYLSEPKSIKNLVIERNNDSSIEIRGEYGNIGNHWESIRDLVEFNIVVYKNDKVKHDFDLENKFLLRSIINYIDDNVYKDSCNVKLIKAKINELNDEEIECYHKTKMEMEHITSDIDALEECKHTLENKLQKVISIWNQDKNSIIYSDQLICVVLKPIIDDVIIGNNYQVFINTSEGNERIDSVKVLDLTYIDQSTIYPKAILSAYKRGSWERYLHKISIKYITKKDKKTEENAYIKKLTKKIK